MQTDGSHSAVTHCLVIWAWSISLSRKPSRSNSFCTSHEGELAVCAAKSGIVKCSSRVMNGGSGGDLGSTAPVDTFKRLNTKVKKVRAIIEVFAVCSERFL